MPTQHNRESLLAALEPVVKAPEWEHLEKEDLLPLRDYYQARDHADFHIIDPINFEPGSLHLGMTNGLTGQILSLPFSLALQLHDSLQRPTLKGGRASEEVVANVSTTVEAFGASKSVSVFMSMSGKKFDKLLVAKRTNAAVMGAFVIAATRGIDKKRFMGALDLAYDEVLIVGKQRRALTRLREDLTYDL